MADITAYKKKNRRAERTLKNIILWWFEEFCVTLHSKRPLFPIGRDGAEYIIYEYIKAFLAGCIGGCTLCNHIIRLFLPCRY